MFAKPASPASPERKPLAASFIGVDVRLTGDLACDGEIHLDGQLAGDAHVTRLMVGETGVVEGAIEAEAVEVRGRVRGVITARAVTLHASADVDGDINAGELAIEAGARFVGRSFRPEPVPPVLTVAAAE